jgi:hypothetical protein
MKEYRGGNKVQKGVYLNRETGELIQMYGEARVLPGGAEVKYARVPGTLAAVGGPLVGLAFVMFLPFIGIVGILGFVAYKAWNGAAALGRKAFRPAEGGQAPAQVHLAGADQDADEMAGATADGGVQTR